jgi:hypothetical protein
MQLIFLEEVIKFFLCTSPLIVQSVSCNFEVRNNFEKAISVAVRSKAKNFFARSKLGSWIRIPLVA